MEVRIVNRREGSNELVLVGHRPGIQTASTVRRTSMQAANNKLSAEDGVVSSQPPKLEDEPPPPPPPPGLGPSQAKTAKRVMFLFREVPTILMLALLVLWLGLWLWLPPSMFPAWLPLVPVLVVVLLPAQTTGRYRRGLVVLATTAGAVFASVMVMVIVLVLPAQTTERYSRGLVVLAAAAAAATAAIMMTMFAPRINYSWCQRLVLVVLQTLKRVMNFWRAHMHGHDGRIAKLGPHEWVLDSGAWIHHTSKLELLLQGGDFQFQEDAPSSSGDDASAPHIQGRGYVRTDCFDFPGVHYVVGDDTRNVVSVSQLARDHGLVTVFEPTSCHVKDKKTGQIVGKGRLRNGMYILDSLHIVGQHLRDGGVSGGDRHDGTDGDGGGRGPEARGNGDGDSTAEGRGGGGRGGGGGGTGARNQEEISGSGDAEGDVNEANEEVEGGYEKELEEMNENDEEDIKEIGEINGKGEKEDDEKRGGQNSGKLPSRPYTGLFRLSPFACILCIVCILCLAACISLPYTIRGAGVAILVFQLVKTSTMQSAICKLQQIGGSLFRGTGGERQSTEEEKTQGAYLQELSHQEHNKRLFGLSRFDATTDPQLPARAFASSTNTTRQEDFFVDSGASFHTTWNESILFHYPQHLQNHTKPPTMSLGGIAAGSIAVTRSGYLNGNRIMLDGVLLALEAQANLVSVGQLTFQYGVDVEMNEVGVVIKKRQNGVQIGGGRMLNNLYVLEYFLPGGLFAHCPTPHP